MKGSRILALVLAMMMVLALVPAMAEDEPVKISVASYMFGPIDNELGEIAYTVIASSLTPMEE